MQVDSNASSAHVFKLAPKLNTLEIEFPSPYGTARPGLTPWVELHDNLEKELGPGHPYTNMGQHPCYNVIVDWILTVLFPYIKHVPNVLLTGAIKASAANKWDYILNKEYNERNLEERTHGYDCQPAMRRICESQ